jgi:hypothetical protein
MFVSDTMHRYITCIHFPVSLYFCLQLWPTCNVSNISDASTHSSAFLNIRNGICSGISLRALYTRVCNSARFLSCSVKSAKREPLVDDPSDDERCEPPPSDSERVGDDERGPVKKLPLFIEVKLSLDAVRVYLGREGLSVAARSDKDLFGSGGGSKGDPVVVAGFGIDSLVTGVFGPIACLNAPSILFDELGLDPGLGTLRFAPVDHRDPSRRVRHP